MGAGVLAIWHEVDDGFDAELVRWYDAEHHPERVAIEGFRQGSRYAAITGSPRYFVYYETASPEVMESAGYRARVDFPTSWTRDVMAHYRKTVRTVFEVAGSRGTAAGPYAATFRLQARHGCPMSAWRDGARALAARALAAHADAAGPADGVAVWVRAGQPVTVNSEQAIRGRDGQADVAVVAWAASLAGLDAAAAGLRERLAGERWVGCLAAGRYLHQRTHKAGQN